MTKRRGKLPRVELLNVPSYRQGTFDSLCAYYTAAMMLSTLFPEYIRSFGEAARTRATRNVSTIHSSRTTATRTTGWFLRDGFTRGRT